MVAAGTVVAAISVAGTVAVAISAAHTLAEVTLTLAAATTAAHALQRTHSREGAFTAADLLPGMARRTSTKCEVLG
jgi:hypothetical protein